MWLLVAPRAAQVLIVMRASGSSRPILASTPRNGVVRGSQPETTARKSSRRLTRRCPVALQRTALHRLTLSWKKAKKLLGGADPERRQAFIEQLQGLLAGAQRDQHLLVYVDE